MNAPSLEIDKQLGPLNATARMYRRVVANLLDHIQKGKFQIIGIDDGEEFTKAETIKAAMELIFNLDECKIIVQKRGHSRHYIYIVLGNEDPEDLICDYSFTDGDPDAFEKTMGKFCEAIS